VLGIAVTYEWQSEVWVTLEPLDAATRALLTEPKGIGLDFLIAVRCPEMAVRKDGEGWADEDIQRMLSGYATTLAKCASDVLAGDFTIFPEVHQYADSATIRRERLLYGAAAENPAEE
jgi:hypothetical protein